MLIFPMRRFRLRSALPYPGGATFCLKPIVPLTIVGPTGTTQRVSMADNGSDSIVLPTSTAFSLGMDLTKAYTGSAVGVGSGSVLVRYARVILEIDDGQTSCRWRTYVGFAPVRQALFGAIGGLEFFRSTFDYSAQQLILDPLANLPLTSDARP